MRSRINLAERGYLVATVEGRKKFPDKNKGACRACNSQPCIEIRVDLWNCFDLIAEHPQKQERIYVQVTDSTSHSKRRNKILASFEAKLVLLAGAKIMVQSWKKNDSNRFVVREEMITLKDFKQALAYPSTVAAMQEIRRKAKSPDLPEGSTLNFG